MQIKADPTSGGNNPLAARPEENLQMEPESPRGALLVVGLLLTVIVVSWAGMYLLQLART